GYQTSPAPSLTRNRYTAGPGSSGGQLSVTYSVSGSVNTIAFGVRSRRPSAPSANRSSVPSASRYRNSAWWIMSHRYRCSHAGSNVTPSRNPPVEASCSMPDPSAAIRNTCPASPPHHRLPSGCTATDSGWSSRGVVAKPSKNTYAPVTSVLRPVGADGRVEREQAAVDAVLAAGAEAAPRPGQEGHHL